MTRVMVGVAAGQATNNGSSVDMKGYDSITFIALIGTIVATGTITLKAQQSSDDGDADAFSDLEGTAIAYTSDDDDKMVILEINCPLKRYVRPVVTTAVANGTIDGVVAIQTKSSTEPVTHDATTVLSAEFHHAPAEGTA